jgi:hypothetical protein
MKQLYRHSRLTIASRHDSDEKPAAPVRRRETTTKAARRSRQLLETPNANTTSWNHMVSCEARNALQIVISGGEILLDGHLGGLNLEQRLFMVKILENARHLANLIATLNRTTEGLGGSEQALLAELEA